MSFYFSSFVYNVFLIIFPCNNNKKIIFCSIIDLTVNPCVIKINTQKKKILFYFNLAQSTSLISIYIYV